MIFRKFLRLCLAMVILGLGHSAVAETTCDGKWIAKYKDLARGWDTTATVLISGMKGTYTADLGRHQAQNSPCRDHTFPAQIVMCTDKVIEFKVDGREVMSPRGNHCPSWHVKLKRIDSDHSEGIFVKEKIPLTMDRK
jgi:hypothetical protein